MKKIFSKQVIITGMICIFFIILMISFSFPDLFALFYVPSLLFKGNIYSLVKTGKLLCLWLDATYPPLYYLTIGVYINLLKFFGLVKSSLFTINPCPIWNLILNKNFLFWVKLPYLIFHLGSSYLFSQFFNKKKFLWFLFWLLNPVIIFVSFIQGQYDIISTFFILLSIYYANKKQTTLSAFSLGLGGAFKHFPFLLLIPFSIVVGRNTFEKIKYILFALIPFIIAVIPFLGKDYFYFLRFSENYKMLQAGLSLGSIKISYYFLLYCLLLLVLSLEKKKNFDVLIKYSFLFSIIYYLTTNSWFVQRLSFLIPSLLLIASKNKKILKILPFFYISFFLYVVFIFPGLFDHTLLKPVSANLKQFDYSILPMVRLKQIVQLFINGVFIWSAFILIRKINVKKVEIKINDILASLTSLIFYLIIIIVMFLIHVR